VRSIGSLAGSGYAQASARSAYGIGKARASGGTPAHVLAERSPAGVARGQLARQASASLDAVPYPGFAAMAAFTAPDDQAPPAFVPAAAGYHGEAGAIADVGKETIAQVSSVNAYKQYLAVFRADDEIQSSLVKIRA
jgi:hypothetical protein